MLEGNAVEIVITLSTSASTDVTVDFSAVASNSASKQLLVSY